MKCLQSDLFLNKRSLVLVAGGKTGGPTEANMDWKPKLIHIGRWDCKSNGPIGTTCFPPP